MPSHKFCVVVPCREEPCYVLHFSFSSFLLFSGVIFFLLLQGVFDVSPFPSVHHQLRLSRTNAPTHTHTHSGLLGKVRVWKRITKKNKLWSTPTQSETFVWRGLCAVLFAFVPRWIPMPMPIGWVVEAYKWNGRTLQMRTKICLSKRLKMDRFGGEIHEKGKASRPWVFLVRNSRFSLKSI